MTGVLKDFWWLLVGAVLALVGAGLMAAVGFGGLSCAGFGTGEPPTIDPCADVIASAERQWNAGAILFVVGLLVIAFGAGYRRGLRRGRRDQSSASVSA
ncbi:MAG: hypothetical protein U0R76_00580 [Candidatus Nanopelagicales bacterium]